MLFPKKMVYWYCRILHDVFRQSMTLLQCEQKEVLIMEKKSAVWTVVKVALAVTAVCAAAAFVYYKFFRKKKELLEETEELAELELELEPGELSEEPSFEADAADVIANAEEMA